MTPTGQRHFRTADQAHRAAKASRAESFVIMHDPRRNEFAWIGPKEFFLTRMPQAMLAGLPLIEGV